MEKATSNNQKEIPEIYLTVLEGKKVVAAWTCDHEDMQQYILQRSFDGLKFENIATVSAKFDPQFLYRVHDDSPFSNLCYYRVRGTDARGCHYFSQVEELMRNEKDFAVRLLQPVSAGSNLLLNVSNAPQGEMLVVIYDRLGKEISSFMQVIRRANESIIRLQLPEKLEEGIYSIVSSLSTGIYKNTLLIKR
jgi:hypothetical protein